MKVSEAVASHLKRPVDTQPWADHTLLTKSEDWAYEQEFRVISAVSERDEDGLVDFPSEALVAMVFGCRMNASQAKGLVDLAGTRFPNLQFSEARRDPREFKLNYHSLSSK